MNNHQHQLLLAAVDWDIRKLSNRLEVIRGSTVHDAVKHVEQALTAALRHRRSIVRELSHADGI
jgi:hypothetical protein